MQAELPEGNLEAPVGVRGNLPGIPGGCTGEEPGGIGGMSAGMVLPTKEKAGMA
jgi:hypothetical protein